MALQKEQEDRWTQMLFWVMWACYQANRTKALLGSNHDFQCWLLSATEGAKFYVIQMIFTTCGQTMNSSGHVLGGLKGKAPASDLSERSTPHSLDPMLHRFYSPFFFLSSCSYLKVVCIPSYGHRLGIPERTDGQDYLYI